MFGGVFSLIAKLLILIFLYTEMKKLAEKKNELLTVLVIKDVITNPTELLITDQNLDISAFLQSTYPHLPVNHNEEWRKYFRIMYL